MASAAGWIGSVFCSIEANIGFSRRVPSEQKPGLLHVWLGDSLGQTWLSEDLSRKAPIGKPDVF